MQRAVSALGLVVMVGLAWAMSSRKRRLPWRVILGGLALQFAFAWMTLHTEPGRAFFRGANDLFVALVSCTDKGTEFVFGRQFMQRPDVLSSFAFRALPTIIFFSALMSLLYYLGLMQWVIRGLAWVMQRTLRTSGAETLSAAANIFVGQTEAPLVVAPYLKDMTRSELMAVMVGGFATVAGGVLAVYVTQFGVSAAHLLTASVISAPAALLVAKVMEPETEVPKTLGNVQAMVKSPAQNAIHAVALGTTDGLKLALNVGAMLIAFLAIIHVVNLLLGWAGGQFGYPELSLELVLGYLFWPLAWLMGVESKDCWAVGQLMGIKMVGNEFLAYAQLHEWTAQGTYPLSSRSVVLATYALCGFANFGSIGIQLGGIGALVPERRGELAQLGLRAMLGGTLAACMTAAVVGVLM